MKEINIAAEVANINAVTDFINEELEAALCPMKAQLQIDVAIDEIFSNIAYYAYTPEKGDATVQISFSDDPKSVSITFIDSGKKYDPLAKEDPDITLSAEDRNIGGLGIYMVKKTMDNVLYEYSDGKNHFTIVKNF